MSSPETQVFPIAMRVASPALRDRGDVIAAVAAT
jgi:hypothetical protein